MSDLNRNGLATSATAIAATLVHAINAIGSPEHRLGAREMDMIAAKLVEFAERAVKTSKQNGAGA